MKGADVLAFDHRQAVSVAVEMAAVVRRIELASEGETPAVLIAGGFVQRGKPGRERDIHRRAQFRNGELISRELLQKLAPNRDRIGVGSRFRKLVEIRWRTQAEPARQRRR